MKRLIDFEEIVDDHWPNLDRLVGHFSDPSRMSWNYGGGDGGFFKVWDLSESIPRHPPMFRTSMATLALTGKRDLGVFVSYRYWDAPLGKTTALYSKGDLSLINTHHVSAHGTPLPKGLFVPFSVAWLAVKHFIETDGGLAHDVPWITPAELPENAFPDPGTWQQAPS